MTEHEQTLELMPDYALGMASPDEQKLVERHVAICRACLDELKRYQVTAEALPQGIILVDPPARLKANILQMAEAGLAASTVKAPPMRPAVQDDVGWWRKLEQTWRSISPVWGLAGLALILVLAVSSALLGGRLSQMQNTSRLRTVGLGGTGYAPGGVGTLVISMDGEHGTLVVDALPVLDESREYQVWLVEGEAWVSGGRFSVDEDGYGAEWVHAPAALASYDAVWVSIEPAGGSEAPTGEIVLGGDL